MIELGLNIKLYSMPLFQHCLLIYARNWLEIIPSKFIDIDYHLYLFFILFSGSACLATYCVTLTATFDLDGGKVDDYSHRMIEIIHLISLSSSVHLVSTSHDAIILDI